MEPWKEKKMKTNQSRIEIKTPAFMKLPKLFFFLFKCIRFQNFGPAPQEGPGALLIVSKAMICGLVGNKK